LLWLACTVIWLRGRDIPIAPLEITGLNDVKVHLGGIRRFETDWSMIIGGKIDALPAT
jgi:hypothetical protein